MTCLAPRGRAGGDAHELGSAGMIQVLKRDLRLHDAEWEAVKMALSAYLARIEDACVSVQAIDGLPLTTAVTMVTSLRLATKSVVSLHNAVVTARDKRERALHWKHHRQAAQDLPYLVRHFAVALLPSLLRDLAAQLKATGHAEAGITFLRLAKTVGAQLQ
ncbi:hypothetical protein SAMN05519103_08593 [Rhizobiales bacterium GAS113]|nr:hypothetical protein SAMN05519103_08593 [Rhizobiales bacterium GAS113]